MNDLYTIRVEITDCGEEIFQEIASSPEVALENWIARKPKGSILEDIEQVDYEELVVDFSTVTPTYFGEHTAISGLIGVYRDSTALPSGKHFELISVRSPNSNLSLQTEQPN